MVLLCYLLFEPSDALFEAFVFGSKVFNFCFLALAVAEAGGGHAFADAALFDEVFLQSLDELAQHDICLMDERDGQVGYRFVLTGLNDCHVVCACVVVGAELLCCFGAEVVKRPLLKSSDP